MNDGRQQKIASIAEQICRLFKELKSRKIRNGEDLWFLHSNSTQYQSDTAAIQFQKIQTEIKSLNRSNLSDKIIISRIIYEIILIALCSPGEAQNIKINATAQVGLLAEYNATRYIDIPLENLNLGGMPFHIGKVSFHPITNTDKGEKWWDRISAHINNRADFHVVSFARVESPGDSDTAVDYAIAAVEKALIILRAIGFPFSTSLIHQIGVLTDFPLSSGRPLRLGRPKENAHIDDYTNNVTLLSPPSFQYHLKEDLLVNIEPTTLNNLIEFLDTNLERKKSGLRSKFLSGLLWLGRATFPDYPQTSITKLAFSLETLLGGDTDDQYLASRGITASLAERSAFVAGSTPQERSMIHRSVTDLYHLRSDIVHGRVTELSDQDLPRYGGLVRSIAWKLLPLLSKFNTIDELQKWILEKRYS